MRTTRIIIHSHAFNDVTLVFRWECPACKMINDFRGYPTDVCGCGFGFTLLNTEGFGEYYPYMLHHRMNAALRVTRNQRFLTPDEQDDFVFEVAAELPGLPTKLDLLLANE